MYNLQFILYNICYINIFNNLLNKKKEGREGLNDTHKCFNESNALNESFGIVFIMFPCNDL